MNNQSAVPTPDAAASKAAVNRHSFNTNSPDWTLIIKNKNRKLYVHEPNERNSTRIVNSLGRPISIHPVDWMKYKTPRQIATVLGLVDFSGGVSSGMFPFEKSQIAPRR